KYGQSYKFRIYGYDPRDIFRGNYLLFNFENWWELAAACREANYEKGETLYWIITTDEKSNISSFSRVTKELPQQGAYIKVKYNGWGIDPPFDRFFINEKRAAAAEKDFQAAVRRKEAYAKISIYNGFAVLENIYCGDEPLVKN
ncbi:MAG: GDYXXLXY domain-containing protein, partial [Victivallaceae bacterium]